ncbi:MAG TPA: type II toxin-antitoxin system prevent-host-death family antitoxin [Minicystis sp.]|nr:type II toxin-antitoxin system prevent-host-death family antitoxin [Minicystis sp.]
MKPSAAPRTMTAAEFKAKCLKVMDDVARTGRPVVVTKRGRPVVTLGPVAPENPNAVIGFMRGRVEILGDILAPVDAPWDVERGA